MLNTFSPQYNLNRIVHDITVMLVDLVNDNLEAACIKLCQRTD